MQINGTNPNINSNVYLNANQALNRIATGVEINQASDNASGLAIANQLMAQSNGYSQAIENTNSAVALNQIADGGLNAQSKILDNIKEKLTQAATDTTSQEGRQALLNGIQGQLNAIDNIAKNTEYNGQTLLQASPTDSGASADLQYQSGIEGTDLIEQTGIQANVEGLGLTALASQDPATFTADMARSYLEQIDNAISTLSDYRGELGATSNQLESATSTLITQESSTLQAASVFNTDYAAESANFSKQNILSQIGAFVQAQGNINQDTVTRLLS